MLSDNKLSYFFFLENFTHSLYLALGILLGCTFGEGLIGIFEGEDAGLTVTPNCLTRY
jgi:hypothetical protein